MYQQHKNNLANENMIEASHIISSISQSESLHLKRANETMIKNGAVLASVETST